MCIPNLNVKRAGQNSTAAVAATPTAGSMRVIFARHIEFHVILKKSVWNAPL